NTSRAIPSTAFQIDVSGGSKSLVPLTARIITGGNFSCYHAMNVGLVNGRPSGGVISSHEHRHVAHDIRRVRATPRSRRIQAGAGRRRSHHYAATEKDSLGHRPANP